MTSAFREKVASNPAMRKNINNKEIFGNDNRGGTDVQHNPFQADSSPFGVTYAEWTARWWQWVLSLPKDVNPLYDNTGQHCTINQDPSSPVFFLVGTMGGSVERTCTIPADKAILFPVANNESSKFEYRNLRNEDELRAYSQADIDLIRDIEVEIDGRKIDNLRQNRVTSGLFSIALPANNLMGAPEGTETEAVSDGYWVFLPPLPAGEHKIHFSSACSKLKIEAEYEVTVR